MDTQGLAARLGTDQATGRFNDRVLVIVVVFFGVHTAAAGGQGCGK